jgi:hypothetical protein
MSRLIAAWRYLGDDAIAVVGTSESAVATRT